MLPTPLCHLYFPPSTHLEKAAWDRDAAVGCELVFGTDLARIRYPGYSPDSPYLFACSWCEYSPGVWDWALSTAHSFRVLVQKFSLSTGSGWAPASSSEAGETHWHGATEQWPDSENNENLSSLQNASATGTCLMLRGHSAWLCQVLMTEDSSPQTLLSVLLPLCQHSAVMKADCKPSTRGVLTLWSHI